MKNSNDDIASDSYIIFILCQGDQLQEEAPGTQSIHPMQHLPESHLSGTKYKTKLQKESRRHEGASIESYICILYSVINLLEIINIMGPVLIFFYSADGGFVNRSR